ncbi:hypothetical protein LXA43DRAFT_899781, partial [Ganoderma leucocontextum]
FLAFVPNQLDGRTQIVLRYLMRRPSAKSDRSGYIYALQLADRARPELVHIKVGRTNDIARRLAQHRRRCPSFKPSLLGRYPWYTGPDLIPYCDRVERLVHVELSELAAKSYPPGRNAPRARCADCGSKHVEIFTFKRLKGTNSGLEWSLIVRPVVERWTRFASQLV